MGYIKLGVAKLRCSQCHGTSYKNITRHSGVGVEEYVVLCLTCGHEKVIRVWSTQTTQPSPIYVFETPKPLSVEEF